MPSQHSNLPGIRRELRFWKDLLLDFRPHLFLIKIHGLSSQTLPEYFMCSELYLLYISSECAYYSNIPNRWSEVLHIP